MTYTMPEFSKLRNNYPDDPSSDAVKQAIGGHVNADWVANTCAIRMSRAFNYSGIKIKHHDHPFMATISGADGNWYAYRMLEMRRWIQANFGAPALNIRGATDRSKFSDRKGIIAFEIHFHDANGHLDLWDGNTYVHESADPRDYFKMSRQTLLWAAP
jgi:Type VI secretion system (T6SS), amidase effector protein 4